jgi:hypothetical protein
MTTIWKDTPTSRQAATTVSSVAVIFSSSLEGLLPVVGGGLRPEGADLAEMIDHEENSL